MRGFKLEKSVSTQHGKLRKQQDRVTFQQVRHANLSSSTMTEKVYESTQQKQN